MQEKLTIGTRGSALALWQAHTVKKMLADIYPDLIIKTKIIKTKGDKILDSALSKIGDKGLFTREIEQQLLEGQIDLAVHSLKDLPTEMPAGLEIAAYPQRELPADAFISKNNIPLKRLPENAIVLSGSLRRQSQLLHIRPDLQIQDVRGNVQTRLSKLEQSDAAGIVLAYAGLKRLGLDNIITEIFLPTEFLPAAGQGALAIQIRSNDETIYQMIKPLNNEPAEVTTKAERSLLAYLQGGCQVPIGAYAWLEDNILHLQAMVATINGQTIIKASGSANHSKAIALGQNVAEMIIKDGGQKILDQCR